MNEALYHTILKKRFLVDKPLDSGQYATIFQLRDLQSKTDDKSFDRYVVKLSTSFEMLVYEIKIMKKIHNKLNKNQLSFQTSHLPKLKDHGMVQLRNVHDNDKPEDQEDQDHICAGYYILPRYQKSIEHFMNDSGQGIKLTPEHILEIGI